METLDISEEVLRNSYSADVICYHSKIRKPISYAGRLYTVTGIMSSFKEGVISAYLIEIVEPSEFEGQTFTYHEKIKPGYHGIVVKCGKKNYVMKGETIEVRLARTSQLNLFFAQQEKQQNADYTD